AIRKVAVSQIHADLRSILDGLAIEVGSLIRPYREGDIPAIVALSNAVDTAYKLEQGTDEEDTHRLFTEPRSDPRRQVLVAEVPAVEGVSRGMLLGYGRVAYENDEENDERVYFLDVLVHPRAEGLGLDRAIARR